MSIGANQVVTAHPTVQFAKLTRFAFADAMIVSHFPHGPTVYFSLHNVQLRHDIESYQNSTVSEQYPHLIFDNFSSRLGVRLRDVLKYLFPVPKEDNKRVMTFSNKDDFVSFRCVPYHVCLWPCVSLVARHHVFVKIPPKQVQLAEVGPRFDMKRRRSWSTPTFKSLTIRSSIRNPSGHDRTEGSRKGVGPRPLLPDSQEEEPSLNGGKGPTNRTRGQRSGTAHQKTETIVLPYPFDPTSLDHIQRCNDRLILIEAQRLVQLRKPFEQGGEEVDGMLDIVCSCGLPNGVHR